MSHSLTMSQFAEGEAEFRKALELDPSDATAAVVSFPGDPLLPPQLAFVDRGVGMVVAPVEPIVF